MNRLTPEALDALLAEHTKCERCQLREHCLGCAGPWPCENPVYLLASEVRDARPVIDGLRRIEDGVDHPRGMSDQTAGFYEAVNWAQGIAREALAHYEEGTK